MPQSWVCVMDPPKTPISISALRLASGVELRDERGLLAHSVLQLLDVTPWGCHDATNQNALFCNTSPNGHAVLSAPVQNTKHSCTTGGVGLRHPRVGYPTAETLVDSDSDSKTPKIPCACQNPQPMDPKHHAAIAATYKAMDPLHSPDKRLELHFYT